MVLYVAGSEACIAQIRPHATNILAGDLQAFKFCIALAITIKLSCAAGVKPELGFLFEALISIKLFEATV